MTAASKFHPGGLAITRELARLTGIATGTSVIEIAADKEQTARILAAEFGAPVTATDVSPE